MISRSSFGFGYRIKHPDWVIDASRSVAKTGKLLQQGVLPTSIETAMVIVPVKRLLRGVYGSDLRAALALLADALWNIPVNAWNMRAVPFWHLRVLRKTREEWLAEDGAKELL